MPASFFIRRDSLLAARDVETLPILQKLVSDPKLRGGAIRGLAAFEDAKTPALLINGYPSFDGASKLAGEALISAYSHMFGVRGCVYRFANVVGERDMLSITSNDQQNTAPAGTNAAVFTTFVH